MYYLMLNLVHTFVSAAKVFKDIFLREPDAITRDHNYWWVGRATDSEVKAAKAAGRLKNPKIINGRDST